MNNRVIYLDNDWTIRRRLSQWNPTTDTYEPVAGLPVTGFLSATPQGGAIHPGLSKTLAERTEVPGDYFAFIDGDALRANIADYIGRFVYEVVVVAGDYRDSARLFVTDSRGPET